MLKIRTTAGLEPPVRLAFLEITTQRARLASARIQSTASTGRVDPRTGGGAGDGNLTVTTTEGRVPRA